MGLLKRRDVYIANVRDLEQLIEQRTETARSQRRECPEFAQLLTEQSTALDNLVAMMIDEKTKQAVWDYDGIKNDISGIQLKAVYKAGALDAVQLLKTMGVI